MSYPKNAASPFPLRARLVSASDGSAITTGVSVTHVAQDRTTAAGGGTLTHITSGEWEYLPTQAETNYDAFSIQFQHASAIAGGVTVHVVTDKRVDALNDMAVSDILADAEPFFGADIDISISSRSTFDVIAQRVRLDSDQPDYAPAKAGAAMTLTPTERDATAVVIESHLLDEGDSQPLLDAIVTKINADLDVPSLELTEIAAAVWDRATSQLTTVGSIGETVVGNLNESVGSRLASADVPANFGDLAIAPTAGTVTAGNMRGTDNASTHSAADVWTADTRSLTDKSGFKLASDGADSVLLPDVTAAEVDAGLTTMLQKLSFLFHRFGYKVVYDKNGGVITVYDAAGTAVAVQSASEASNVQTVEEIG